MNSTTQYSPDRAQMQNAFEIAVLVPCYNEAVAIETVIRDFQAALPSATIYVLSLIHI